jgi:hypothetical protein
VVDLGLNPSDPDLAQAHALGKLVLSFKLPKPRLGIGDALGLELVEINEIGRSIKSSDICTVVRKD